MERNIVKTQSKHSQSYLTDDNNDQSEFGGDHQSRDLGSTRSPDLGLGLVLLGRVRLRRPLHARRIRLPRGRIGSGQKHDQHPHEEYRQSLLW